MKSYTLKLVEEDRVQLKSDLLQYQQQLATAQTSILRVEGALILLNQIEKYIQDVKEE